MDWQHLLPYLAPIIVLALVARRLIRNAPRKVKPWRVFVPPAIIAALVTLTFATMPMPAPIWTAGFVAALAAGGLVGFLMTHHQEFTIDRDTGEITVRATPIGLILVGAFFVIRYGAKYVVSGGDPYAAQNFQPNVHPSASLIAWTDVGLMFSVGLVFARAITTWLRTRPLIAAHKEATASAAALPPSTPAELPPGHE